MKQTKKFLSVFLALLMIFSSVPLSGSITDFSLFTLKASAANVVASGAAGTDATWTLDDAGVFTVSGTGDMTSNLTDNLPTWYYDIEPDTVKSVVVEDGITSICAYAFAYLKGVESVTIADSVITIGDGAFYNCQSLKNIVIPNKVESIGAETFYYCKALESVVIPAGVKTIGERAFFQCRSLKNLTIPNGVTSIGEYAFYHCDVLENLTIPDSVKSIGQQAFYYCENIKLAYSGTNKDWSEITNGANVVNGGELNIFLEGTCGNNLTWHLKDDVLTISGYGDMDYYNPMYLVPWYDYRKEIKEVIFEDGITSISEYAIYDMDLLTSVVIPDSVTTLKKGAFCGSNFTSITIPTSVTTIEEDAFHSCDYITDVYYLGTREQWDAISISEKQNSNLTNANIDFAISATGTCGDDLSWQFNKNTGVLKIDGYSEMYNYSETERAPWYDIRSQIKEVVVIGAYSIGEYAFSDLTSLEKIFFYNWSFEVKENAFNNCVALQEVFYNYEDYEWEDYVYISEGNDYLVNAPHFITYKWQIDADCGNDGYESGMYCNNCSEYVEGGTVIPATGEHRYNSIDVCTVCGFTYETLYGGICGDNLTWLMNSNNKLIISGTGEMYDYVNSSENISPWFYSCHAKIKSIVVENGVTSIGSYAFFNCNYVTEVVIPESVTKINEGAFVNCGGLISVKLPAKLENISFRLFNNCQALESITIPDNVTFIDEEAFSGCAKLTDITLGKNVTEIKASAFSLCTKLDTVNYIGNEEEWNNINIDNSNRRNDNIVKAPHVVVNKDNMEPTCVAVGYKEGKYCIKCKEYVSGGTEIPATGIHSIVAYDAKEPTLDEVGWDAYEECSVCDYTTYKEIPALDSVGGECGENLTWVLTKDGTLTISGTGKMDNYHYDMQPWDSYSDKIYTIIVEDGVTQIGRYAFEGCTNLTNVTISDSVRHIGDSAFSDCTGLTSITLPDSMLSIQYNAFFACMELTSVTIPEGVTKIENNTFYNCSKLTSITIPESVNAIELYAFYQCTSLDTVYFGGSEEQWNAIEVGNANEPIVNVSHVVIAKDGFAPTCSEPGIAAGQWCIKCAEYVSGGTEIPAAAHTGGEATCISAAICEKCGNAYGEANPENHKNTEIRDAVLGTCSVKGYTGDLWCNDCDTLVKLGTDEYDYNVHNYVGGQCVDCQNLNAVMYFKNDCSWENVNAYLWSNDTVNIYIWPGVAMEKTEDDLYVIYQNDDTGHDFVFLDYIIFNDTNGTQTTDLDFVCCGIYSGNNREIIGYRHSYVDSKCEYCGAIECNHENTEIRNSETATCGKDGYTGDTYCADCDILITKGIAIPATGVHTGGEATCTVQANCAECGNAYGELNADNHKSKETVTGIPATCGEEGLTDGEKCTDCGEFTTVQETIPATGKHTGGEATCTKKAVCEVCTHSYGEVNADNHRSTSVINAADATCGKDGYTGDTFCDDCEKIVAQGEKIVATGEHKNTEVVGQIDATYESDGYTGDKYCLNCEQLVKKGTAIPKLEKPTEPDAPDIPDAPNDDNCDHLCHSNSKFVQLIWKIVRFFQKLFKIEQYCDCGAQHW